MSNTTVRSGGGEGGRKLRRGRRRTPCTVHAGDRRGSRGPIAMIAAPPRKNRERRCRHAARSAHRDELGGTRVRPCSASTFDRGQRVRMRAFDVPIRRGQMRRDVRPARARARLAPVGGRCSRRSRGRTPSLALRAGGVCSLRGPCLGGPRGAAVGLSGTSAALPRRAARATKATAERPASRCGGTKLGAHRPGVDRHAARPTSRVNAIFGAEAASRARSGCNGYTSSFHTGRLAHDDHGTTA